MTTSFNHFWVYDEERTQISISLMKAPSNLVNHSCKPNLMYFFKENRVVLRAMRDIEEGEMLCINYLDDRWLNSYDVKQEFMKAHWGFACGCEKCEEEKNRDISKREVIFEVEGVHMKDFINEILEIEVDRFNYLDNELLFKKLTESILKFGIHVPFTNSLCFVLFDAAIELGKHL